MTRDEVLKIIDQAAAEGWTELDLSRNGLTEIPAEIAQLHNLTTLDLKHNKITEIPAEIAQLHNLTHLSLHDNQIKEIPEAITQLSNLTTLHFGCNQIKEIPEAISQLSNLTDLALYANQIKEIPEAISQLSNLTDLALGSNKIKGIPKAIAQLQNLTKLILVNSQITEISEAITQLSNLTELYLQINQITEIPEAIAQLSNLTELCLHNNQITEIPEAISQLHNLTHLSLHDNQIKEIPEAIAQLQNLTSLNLSDNQITEIPEVIAQLSNLTYLRLSDNQITRLPLSLHRLDKLREIYLDRNPLEFPPPEIVQQGTKAILTYLKEIDEQQQKSQVSQPIPQYKAKLILLGEGGVGKTSLLKNLSDQTFNPTEGKTSGIEVHPLTLPHPDHPNISLHLNCWDFGGQEIYHATHQFFLTNRCLFLLLWNARLGYQQGRLPYWLNTLKSIAPDSPVVIIATHTDQHSPDLPFHQLQQQFPQIVSKFQISNLTQDGIPNLKHLIAYNAARLPHVGTPFPTSWQQASQALTQQPEKYISPLRFSEICQSHGVKTEQTDILATYLHETGEILYFRDNPKLQDLVILDPQWVSQTISKILESTALRQNRGILTQNHIQTAWVDLPPFLQNYLLEIMHNFDLSYPIRNDTNPNALERALVVNCLPTDIPNYQTRWDAIEQSPDCEEKSITYKFKTIPAGIPTWFIAREHRFSTDIIWRNGALLQHQNHLALLISDAQNTITLSVRGIYPQTFFTLLRDGFELTLNRFQGLEVERLIPCPSNGCTHQFDLAKLETRILRGKKNIECPDCLEDISVEKMLFGFSQQTQLTNLPNLSREFARLHLGQAQILQQNNQGFRAVLEQNHRNFLKLIRIEQDKLQTHCPRMFSIRPKNLNSWRNKLFGQTFELHLYCEAPGCCHPLTAGEGQAYELKDPANWIKTVSPYLRELLDKLKYVAPLLGAFAGLTNPEAYEKLLKDDLEIIADLLNIVPTFNGLDRSDLEENPILQQGQTQLYGSTLNELYRFLIQQDPTGKWQGITKTITPEGDVLWLCDRHAAEFR